MTSHETSDKLENCVSVSASKISGHKTLSGHKKVSGLAKFLVSEQEMSRKDISYLQ